MFCGWEFPISHNLFRSANGYLTKLLTASLGVPAANINRHGNAAIVVLALIGAASFFCVVLLKRLLCAAIHQRTPRASIIFP
jgi:hypothetical protein